MDLRVGNAGNEVKENQLYDLIIICHVLERLPNPVLSFANLRNFLAPGGAIYVEVPDTEPFSAQSLVNAHTYYFTTPTLLAYLNQTGFKAAVRLDKKIIGAIGFLAKKADTGNNQKPSELTGEFKRMKRVIRRAERRAQWRGLVKTALQRLGLYPIIRRLKKKIEPGR